jgi:hypothetical protein
MTGTTETSIRIRDASLEIQTRYLRKDGSTHYRLSYCVQSNNLNVFPLYLMLSIAIEIFLVGEFPVGAYTYGTMRMPPSSGKIYAK